MKEDRALVLTAPERRHTFPSVESIENALRGATGHGPGGRAHIQICVRNTPERLCLPESPAPPPEIVAVLGTTTLVCRPAEVTS